MSVQSGRRAIGTSSSPLPKSLNRKLRDRSRSTLGRAGHDRSTSSGASNSFSIHAEYKFSVARFHELRKGHRLPGVALGDGGLTSLTSISRVICPHSAGACSRTSVACHVPGAGDATSAKQKYGGAPRL